MRIGSRPTPARRRSKGAARGFAALALVVLTGACASVPDGTPDATPTTAAAPAAPLVVRAVADGPTALTVSWHGGQDRPVTVEWRDAGVDEWRRRPAPDDGRPTDVLDGLATGRPVEVRVRAGDVTSPVVTATPRDRGDCSYVDFQPSLPGVSAFCTFDALDASLRARGIDPSTLTCRGRPIDVWDARVPDCIYRHGDRQEVLLRGADRVPSFAAPLPADDARSLVHDALWGGPPPPAPAVRDGAPADRVLPPGAASASTFTVDVGDGLTSRGLRLVPSAPRPGRVAVFSEGHDASAVEGRGDRLGLFTPPDELLAPLLGAGFETWVLDLPLEGANAVDRRPGLPGHTALVGADRGGRSPIAAFVDPVRAVLDRVEADARRVGAPDPLVVLAGRSGGGWLAALASAADPRVDATAVIAGVNPQSQALLDPLGPWELGDAEQHDPTLTTFTPVEVLTAAAGSRALFVASSAADPCCHRLGPADPFHGWLPAARTAAGTGPVTVAASATNPRHGLDAEQQAAFAAWLAEVAR